jgi:hypothetical protein
LDEGEFKFTEEAIEAATTPVGVFTGNFTATIESRPGWEGVTPTTITFPIEVGQDGCVKIRFKMRRIVPVTVYKIDANHEPLADWTIKAVPGPGNLFAYAHEAETSDVVTSALALTTTTAVTGGFASFTLTPGLWIFTEMAPEQDMDEAPNSYVPIVPPTGRQELLIPDPEDLSATSAFTLVFKNELVTGCFIVRKVGLIGTGDDSPTVLGDSYNVAGWGFKLLRKDGTVARQGVTDGNGEIRFDNLPLGPYVIVEEDRPGWNEVSPDQVDILVSGNVCNDPTAVVQFENEQDESGFCIEGRKIDANGGYGIFGWEIAIKPLDEGGFDPANVFTNGLGEFRFDFPRDDYRIPGAQYEVCEQEQDGWLPHSETCQTVRLPEWPGACVQLADFVNQQVGHTESQQHDDHHEGEPGKDGAYHDGPSQDGQNHDDGYNDGPNQGDPNHDDGYNDGPNQGGQNQDGQNHDGGYNDGPSQGGQNYNGPSQGDPNQSGGYNDGPSQGGQNHDGGQQCSQYHTVQAGEGLYEIGAQYHVSPQAMLDANPDVRKGDELWVYVGQQICIP